MRALSSVRYDKGGAPMADEVCLTELPTVREALLAEAAEGGRTVPRD